MRRELFHPRNRLVFILGHPLGHSLSPVMQNAAFQALRLPWVYAPLDLEAGQIVKLIEFIKAPEFGGANVTVPYKEKVQPFLEGVDPEAGWLGSVNTIYRRDGKLWGASTDGEGFLRSLGSRRNRLRGSCGLLLGAGGAAKAVAGAMAKSGIASLWVANRSPKRAMRLVKSLRERYARLRVHALSVKEGEQRLSQCDWVVQATTVGLKEGDPSPLTLGHLPASSWVADLIYHRKTAFLKEAKRFHLSYLDGLGMLLHQGALSFEIWTGRRAPLAVMWKVLLSHRSIE